MNNDTLQRNRHRARRNPFGVHGGASSMGKGLDARLNKVDQVVAWMGERIDMRFYALGRACRRCGSWQNV